MSLSSGGPGPYDARHDAGREIDRESYERTLADLRRVLDTVPVVGFPKRGGVEQGELTELERLVYKYPEQAREILGRAAGQ